MALPRALWISLSAVAGAAAFIAVHKLTLSGFPLLAAGPNLAPLCGAVLAVPAIYLLWEQSES